MEVARVEIALGAALFVTGNDGDDGTGTEVAGLAAADGTKAPFTDALDAAPPATSPLVGNGCCWREATSRDALLPPPTMLLLVLVLLLLLVLIRSAMALLDCCSRRDCAVETSLLQGRLLVVAHAEEERDECDAVGPLLLTRLARLVVVADAVGLGVVAGAACLLPSLCPLDAPLVAAAEEAVDAFAAPATGGSSGACCATCAATVRALASAAAADLLLTLLESLLAAAVPLLLATSLLLPLRDRRLAAAGSGGLMAPLRLRPLPTRAMPPAPAPVPEVVVVVAIAATPQVVRARLGLSLLLMVCFAPLLTESDALTPALLSPLMAVLAALTTVLPRDSSFPRPATPEAPPLLSPVVVKLLVREMEEAGGLLDFVLLLLLLAEGMRLAWVAPLAAVPDAGRGTAPLLAPLLPLALVLLPRLAPPLALCALPARPATDVIAATACGVYPLIPSSRSKRRGPAEEVAGAGTGMRGVGAVVTAAGTCTDGSGVGGVFGFVVTADVIAAFAPCSTVDGVRGAAGATADVTAASAADVPAETTKSVT